MASPGDPPIGRQEDSAMVRQEDSAIVRLTDVHKSFGATEVLRGISMNIAKGEAVCVIGPSGSGKSTLLRCINGLIPIDRGEIHVGPHAVHRLKSDKDMIALRKDVSIVFQQYNLFPHKTALQNVMMAPIHVLRENEREVRERAIALLTKVGLAEKQDAYPGELSGGQQQRVAIARALVTTPSIVLADEPTGNLDTRTSIEVMSIFQHLNRDRGITVLLITHERDIAEYADRIITCRDGHIVTDTPVAVRRIAEDELKALPIEVGA